MPARTSGGLTRKSRWLSAAGATALLMGGAALPSAAADGLTTPGDVTVDHTGPTSVTLSWGESENESG